MKDYIGKHRCVPAEHLPCSCVMQVRTRALHLAGLPVSHEGDCVIMVERRERLKIGHGGTRPLAIDRLRP